MKKFNLKDAEKISESCPRNCYLFYTEEEYQEMLCKFGPEGLWIIADKLKEVAREDVSSATEESFRDCRQGR